MNPLKGDTGPRFRFRQTERRCNSASDKMWITVELTRVGIPLSPPER